MTKHQIKKLAWRCFCFNGIKGESLNQDIKIEFKSGMKNKISFTSVLKSKGSRQLNLSSVESQSRQPRLIDLYQEFQTNPNKTYTL